MLKTAFENLEKIISNINPPLDYIIAKIPKRKDKLRTLLIPNPQLKSVQREILKLLYQVFQPVIRNNKVLFGGIPGRSVIANANQHLNQLWFIKFDIKDFFDSCRPHHLNKFFNLYFSYYNDISPDNSDKRLLYEGKTLADLIYLLSILPKLNKHIVSYCFYKKHRLPQGAPTSPLLANFCMLPIDYMIRKCIRKIVDDKTSKWLANFFDLFISGKKPKISPILIRQLRKLLKSCIIKLIDSSTKLSDHFKNNFKKQLSIKFDPTIFSDQDGNRNIRVFIFSKPSSKAPADRLIPVIELNIDIPRLSEHSVNVVSSYSRYIDDVVISFGLKYPENFTHVNLQISQISLVWVYYHSMLNSYSYKNNLMESGKLQKDYIDNAIKRMDSYKYKKAFVKWLLNTIKAGKFRRYVKINFNQETHCQVFSELFEKKLSKHILNLVNIIVSKAGFKLNREKIRVVDLFTKHNHAKVTGVTIYNSSNGNEVKVGKKTKSFIRSLVYHKFVKKDSKFSDSQIRGYLNWVKNIEPDFLKNLAKEYSLPESLLLNFKTRSQTNGPKTATAS
jgi:F0F1-type ATP synthase delta subunit